MKKAIPVTACAAALMLAAGVIGHAIWLMKKRPIEELYEARRRQDDFVSLQDMPKRLVKLVIEAEDSDFYKHGAFCWEGIRDAAKMNRQAGKIAMGGSTITQQLAKNLYFRFDHSYVRKALELAIALEIERTLDKDKILELYLNVIYFGNGVYGIGDAARFYFGKEPGELSANQMFMLAILPTVPTRGNPIQHPEVFERFRNKRLTRFANPKRPLFTPQEAELIRSYHAGRLDPELRKADEFTDNYPQYITLTNERFGPFHNAGYRNPMEHAQA